MFLLERGVILVKAVSEIRVRGGEIINVYKMCIRDRVEIALKVS